ncbi:MAG: MBL fold metallo-hydrolase [Gemmatimonadaceae bacterium]
MIVRSVTVGALQTNCYLVEDPDSDALAIIDPGAEPERLIAAIEETGREPEVIWVTHAHLDHIGGIAAIKRRWDIPIWLHPLDQPLYRIGGKQAELYGLPFDEPPMPDKFYGEGDKLSLGALELTVMHAPGHAPGHVVLHGHGNAIVGDCLFAGSVGRTDLPFSKPHDLTASLERIAALPSETIVHPGHGMNTTIGEERRSNPFLNGTARIVRA